MKHLLHFSISLIFLIPQILCNSVNAQPSIQWQKALGGTGADQGEYIVQTKDSGYIIAASSNSTDGDITMYHDSDECWIIKLNPSGSIAWQKNYGGPGEDFGLCVRQTKDGGYIVAGGTSSVNGDVTYNRGLLDAWIIKLDDTGKIVWQKTYGGSKRDCAFYIQQTSDSGYIFSGYSDSNDSDVTNNHGGRDCWVVRINDTGKIVWQKTLGGSSTDYALSVQQTNDGGYITAGYTYSTNGQVVGSHTSPDGWVVKLDDTGAIKWQRALGGSGFDAIYAIQQTFDNGYIAVGGTNSADGDVTGLHGTTGTGDMWVVKLDDTGAISWENCYGGSANESANFVYQTADSGYLVTGYASSIDGDVSNAYGGSDYWILKLSQTGSLTAPGSWQTSLGGSSNESAFCGVPTYDNGFAIVGWTTSNDNDVTGNHGGYDVWAVKLSFTLAVNTISIANKDLKVYPTLTNGIVKIEMPAGYEHAHISLLNSLGQDLHVQTEGNALMQRVQIKDVSAGMYFLQIVNGGELSTFRIMYQP
jgi:hypothetical protein